jgi:ABC-2 type transport system ATP-binding protein
MLVGPHRRDGGPVNAIEVAGITKTFSTTSGRVTALDTLDLVIPEGGVFGLLGPNGAGKSTLLRLICGLVRADRGDIRILGHAADIRARKQIGALIDAPLFYPFLTGREVLRTLAHTSCVEADPMALLDRVGLADAADRPVAGYSLGMKQRLGIAAALLNDPQIVILDEPTNGLDPDGIIEMRRLVRALADDEGRTVLLSSHLLDEVQRVCDRVAILRSGCLAAEGRVADLLGGERLRLDVRQVDMALTMLGNRGALEAGGIMIDVSRDAAPDLIRRLVAAGVDIYEARWLRGNLEEIFLTRTRDAA